MRSWDGLEAMYGMKHGQYPQVKEAAFCGTSTGEADPGFLAGANVKVRITARGNARPVLDYSTSPHAAEHLYAPGQSFQVTHLEKTPAHAPHDRATFEIHLTEI